jgi:hypothetical protein
MERGRVQTRHPREQVHEEPLGISPNFTSDQGQDKVKDFFGRDGKYERLVALKNEYDPTNLFRLNQNIKPTAHSGAASS